MSATTTARYFRRGDHVLIDDTPGRIWAIDGPRPGTDHGTAYIYFAALSDDGRVGTAVIVTPDLTASMYKHRTLVLVRPDDSPVVTPTDPPTGAVTAPTPAPVDDTTPSLVALDAIEHLAAVAENALMALRQAGPWTAAGGGPAIDERLAKALAGYRAAVTR